ncbi:SRPBCC domain-containing protein [Kitasatospora sp. NPDC006697]|uniref:SRPBCC domain-containing protein n=1 Tax=Kitasatospora sp. NPDC006697 TaxID=3364020 RepID=UPI0036B80EA7
MSVDLDRICREIAIAAPVERVWAVLTTPEHIGRWFGTGTPAAVDLRPGGSIVFDHPPHGALPARIEVLEPPHRLAYRWAVTGPQDAEPTARNSTLVEYRLTATPDGGTLLRMVESGLAAVLMGDQERADRHAANSAGWTRILAGLRTYAEPLAA